MSRRAAAAFVLAAAVLAAALATPVRGQQQVFNTLSSGSPPPPLPTPSAFPYEWYGIWYYPAGWPVCNGPTPYRGRCRPPHSPLWPPRWPPKGGTAPGGPSHGQPVAPPRPPHASEL